MCLILWADTQVILIGYEVDGNTTDQDEQGQTKQQKREKQLRLTLEVLRTLFAALRLLLD